MLPCFKTTVIFSFYKRTFKLYIANASAFYYLVQVPEMLKISIMHLVVSHAPNSFGKESGNFSRVSVCRKNAI